MKIKLWPDGYDPHIANVGSVCGSDIDITPEEIKKHKKMENEFEIVDVNVNDDGEPIVPVKRWFQKIT